MGRDLEIQHIFCRVPLPFPAPREGTKPCLSLLPLGLGRPSPLLLAQVRLCECWEQAPTGESACYFCRDVLNRRHRKPGSEACPRPRPGPAPNVTTWGWGPHPLPLGEVVRMKMAKSREKNQQNPAGAQSVTALLIEWREKASLCFSLGGKKKIVSVILQSGLGFRESRRGRGGDRGPTIAAVVSPTQPLAPGPCGHLFRGGFWGSLPRGIIFGPV